MASTARFTLTGAVTKFAPSTRPQKDGSPSNMADVKILDSTSGDVTSAWGFLDSLTGPQGGQFPDVGEVVEVEVYAQARKSRDEGGEPYLSIKATSWRYADEAGAHSPALSVAG